MPSYSPVLCYFYPRSPCGERPANWFDLWGWAEYFYPRSPCGERPGQNLINGIRLIISIHALLAESDCPSPQVKPVRGDFYPRSPCGERREEKLQADTTGAISIHALLAESDVTVLGIQHRTGISIHALLAESDTLANKTPFEKFISIHALLAESDKTSIAGRITSNDFYPRSPCGERPGRI